MTLAEVVRRWREHPSSSDAFVAALLDAIEADPDFTLRDRVAGLAVEYERAHFSMSPRDTGGIASTKYTGRRLRELLGPVPPPDDPLAQQFAADILGATARWRANRKNPPPDLLRAVDQLADAARRIKEDP